MSCAGLFAGGPRLGSRYVKERFPLALGRPGGRAHRRFLLRHDDGGQTGGWLPPSVSGPEGPDYSESVALNSEVSKGNFEKVDGAAGSGRRQGGFMAPDQGGRWTTMFIPPTFGWVRRANRTHPPTRLGKDINPHLQGFFHDWPRTGALRGWDITAGNSSRGLVPCWWHFA